MKKILTFVMAVVMTAGFIPAGVSAAGWEHSQYSVAVTAGPGGSAKGSVSQAQAGDRVMITATPDEGYELNRIEYFEGACDTAVVIRGNSFIMPESDVLVVALFKKAEPVPKEYGISLVFDGSHGTAKATNSQGMEIRSAEGGQQVRIAVTPGKSYMLGRITMALSNGEVIDITGAKSFNMPESDIVVNVDFIEKMPVVNEYSIDLVFDGSHGTAKATDSQGMEIQRAKGGQQVRIAATPGKSYMLGRITMTLTNGEVIDITGAKSFNMPESDIIVNVDFAEKTPVVNEYSIDLVFNESRGFAEAQNSQGEPIKRAKGNDLMWVFAMPKTGYKKGSIIVETADGKIIDVSELRSFRMPESDVVITVTFESEKFATKKLAGDINSDGKVNSKDKTIISRYISSWIGYEEKILNWDAADINDDGTVNSKDKTILNRFLAGWEGYDIYFTIN